MAWPNPFRRKDENTRNAWGYTFQWTPDHSSTEDMHPLRYSYDTLGEEALNRLDQVSPPISLELPRNSSRAPSKENNDLPPKRNLYALLRDHVAEDEKLRELWDEVNSVPHWVDWDQISRGQEVFYRYAAANITALAYQSLLGGMGAARVTEVLARTGGFSTKVAKKRMYETTQHILQVTKSLDSIKPGGEGHVSSIRVRLLHAAVRRRIMKLAADRPSYYSVEEYGIPINDLDSIATISTFSSTLIWLGLPRQGIFVRQQEIKDYIALWRLVAYYLGTPTEYFETPEKARCIMESIFLSEVRPSETSKILANNIILSLESPTYASRDFLTASARWLNGNELADALGLGIPGHYYTCLVAGQCIFFMCLTYTYRSFEYLDRRKIKILRALLYQVLVMNKEHGLGEETSFEFQYIPSYGFLTEPGEHKSLGAKVHGIERRNLRTLVVATGVVGVASYFWMITTRGFVGYIKAWWSSS